MREEILQTIIKRTADVMKKNADELNADSSFEALGFKSGNYVQVTTVLEDEFEVEIPYMDFKRRKTFGEAAEYVEQLVEG
ncbi:acyl carrier protein [Anoxybacterium hadale]|uniref:Acyl carrier protein n=1 Tax=Anoxybacterium hadale TaxID=3408580 RepID=A0ACD1AHL0_9FIRM|nr:acyl carrier protein [Clostridiales bacterium]